MELIINSYYLFNCQNSLNVGAEIADYTGLKKMTTLSYRLENPGLDPDRG
jgi:hypothetical protein